MNPTVSVTMISRAFGNRNRRDVGSRVANNWSSARTAELVIRLSNVDLPAFV